jgi:hypothetical protein
MNIISQTEWWRWIDRLRGSIGCPIDWDDTLESSMLKRELRLHWEATAESVQVCNEMSYYRQGCAATLLNAEALRSIEINAQTWRQRAADRYDAETAFFRLWKHLTPEQYPKHFLYTKGADCEAISGSQNGDAQFFPFVSHEGLVIATQTILASIPRIILRFRPAHIYAKTRIPTGGSNGKIADAMRYDFDYSTNQIHAHPIQLSEKPAGEDWLDELHGGTTQRTGYPFTDALIDEEWVVGLRDDIQ